MSIFSKLTNQKSPRAGKGEESPSTFAPLFSSRMPACCQGMLWLILFILLPLPAYWNSFDASWHFDDTSNILENRDVHMDRFSWEALKKAALSHPGGWRPVAYLSFACNHLLNGTDVFGYHVFNVLLLGLTGTFFFLCLRFILTDASRKNPIRFHPDAVAFSVAALWVVHPLHTQTVTYVVQRMNLMASLFSTLAFFLYLSGRGREAALHRGAFFALAFLSFLLALGSVFHGNSFTLCAHSIEYGVSNFRR